MPLDQSQARRLNEILTDLQKYHLLSLNSCQQESLNRLFESRQDNPDESEVLARIDKFQQEGLGQRENYDLALLAKEFMNIVGYEIANMGDFAGEIFIQTNDFLLANNRWIYRRKSSRKYLPKILFVTEFDVDLRYLKGNIAREAKSEDKKNENAQEISLDDDYKGQLTPRKDLIPDENAHVATSKQDDENRVLQLLKNIDELPKDLQKIATSLKEDIQLGLRINCHQIAQRHYNNERNGYNKARRDLMKLESYIRKFFE